jgi:hypothetical protein
LQQLFTFAAGDETPPHNLFCAGVSSEDWAGQAGRLPNESPPPQTSCHEMRVLLHKQVVMKKLTKGGRKGRKEGRRS